MCRTCYTSEGVSRCVDSDHVTCSQLTSEHKLTFLVVLQRRAVLEKVEVLEEAQGSEKPLSSRSSASSFLYLGGDAVV